MQRIGNLLVGEGVLIGGKPVRHPEGTPKCGPQRVYHRANPKYRRPAKRLDK